MNKEFHFSPISDSDAELVEKRYVIRKKLSDLLSEVKKQADKSPLPAGMRYKIFSYDVNPTTHKTVYTTQNLLKSGVVI